MPSKSLKVTVPIPAQQVEEAIALLSERFLRANRTGCKVVTETTEFNLARLCAVLIDDWQTGKVGFAAGDVTLTFTSGKLSNRADVLVYVSAQGDRFLYTGEALAVDRRFIPEQESLHSLSPEAITQLTESLQTIAEVLTELVAQQRVVAQQLQRQPWRSDLAKGADPLPASFLQQLQSVLDAQTAALAQMVANQITATARHFSDRLEQMQTQLTQISTQLQELQMPLEAEPLRPPQTEGEWLKRIQDTWGTVGDYEQYSFSYRTANTETPLFSTPDWIALCELDWARKLHPSLAFLYDLIHGENGIGYTGADILQQFGCHLDPHTGDRYYIYHQGGFTAYEALWQTANHPQQSWLPELQRFCSRIANRHHDIFELFGWEPEAIASLESVVKRATYERQSGRQSGSDSTQRNYQKRDPTLSEYLALLNIGPFTPLTIETIKRAYRQAMKTAHPDTGGSKEQAQQINEAYTAVLQHYFPQVK